ncbi:DUF4397 domain-containing protein [Microbacterium sp. RU33B]|uniref:DUF4397 domain-containing protein n=1 Tax=Microbacterium sp. RU33B TaxID=1907390 RepID=UPI0009658E02|nr:DUF4397 domain-containing protein [Microbacterium sp. RU33B]SIT71507.1 protein of unknown function [Microbacterium sp. RU33B]
MEDHTLARRGRRAALGIVAAAVVALGALVAAPATAAPGDPVGWLRLGHLSPDTKSVDVRVSARGSATPIIELTDVSYGDVSTYSELPPGSYSVSMVPAGSSRTTAPAISASVRVSGDTATTVAAYGPSKDLQVKAFTDDLTQPAAGNARIRLVQASTLTPRVDVSTSTGTPIARGAVAGSATAYAEIPAGPWTLELTGGAIRDVTDVSVGSGSVTTLFVVDTADGGLTILPILDSASAGAVPDGGVQTGGGWLAHSVVTVGAVKAF